MTHSRQTASRISVAFFLALTGQSLLLIPHRQISITDRLSPLAIIGAGAAAWLIGRWLHTAVLINYGEKVRQYACYTASATTIIFALLYANAGLVIESLVLAWLVFTTLLEQDLETRPVRLWTRLAIALLNLVLGISLIVAPRLFSAAIYRPLLEWQTELGVLFFLTSLYALPILIRKHTPTSSLVSYLLAIPWIGYLLAFFGAGNIGASIPSLTLIFGLAIAPHVPWNKMATPNFNEPTSRLLQALYLGETALLFVLTGLLRLTEKNIQDFGSAEAAFVFFLILTAVTFATTLGISLTLHKIAKPVDLPKEAEPAQSTDLPPAGPRFPLVISLPKYQKGISWQLQSLEQKNQALEQQLAIEKRKINHLLLLKELNKQLEPHLDPPVAAQLAVSMIERALNCALAVVLLYEAEHRQFKIIATAGTQIKAIPTSYYEGIKSEILGPAARQRKTRVVRDARSDPNRTLLQNQTFLSEVSTPLIHHGYLKGILVVESEKPAAFSPLDIEMIEAVGAELIRAWERFDYNQRLTDLIQAGITLSTMFEPQTAIEEIAKVTRQALKARGTFVALMDQEGKFTRTSHSGNAEGLLERLILDPSQNPFVRATLTAHHPFRIRDVRKSKYAAIFNINNPSLCSLLAIPIRLHRLSIGIILAFGKQDELFFSENDEALARLLSSQAAAVIESGWLYQELRATLGTATLLYQLSSNVIQAERMEDAAKIVAETAFHLSKANQVGVILFSAENETLVQLTVDASGMHHSARHPRSLIEQACKGEQSIFISSGPTLRICYPLRTPLRNYGALWLEIAERNQVTPRYTSNLQALANQAAVALERALLLVESRQQARALERAYREMENTYDQTLAALTSALDARDRETKGHSLRVAKIASLLGQAMGLSERQIKALERGAILHDIGKIGIQDTILHKPGPLNEAEWRIMRMHPEIGARIIEGIPFLEESLPVIRYHQERWDGSGYPVGLRKTDIPTLARIFAVADAFDALTSTRPYRRKSSLREALTYLQQQAGILFDPKIVDVFEQLVKEGKIDELMVSR